MFGFLLFRRFKGTSVFGFRLFRLLFDPSFRRYDLQFTVALSRFYDFAFRLPFPTRSFSAPLCRPGIVLRLLSLSRRVSMCAGLGCWSFPSSAEFRLGRFGRSLPVAGSLSRSDRAGRISLLLTVGGARLCVFFLDVSASPWFLVIEWEPNQWRGRVVAD